MCRVLVAEDDREMRRLVVEALRKDGHVVVEVADGGGLADALDQAVSVDREDERIDVVVSDVRMPGASGLEVAERCHRALRKVAFILMTAFGDDDVRRRARAIGALLLDKPLGLGELRGAVLRLAPR